LLRALAKQATGTRFTFSVIVADNDVRQSARVVVEECASEAALSIQYCAEPKRNIAAVRNTALAMAQGEFVAWIDDDETPAGAWLDTLYRCCMDHAADAVLGPVVPYFEKTPPTWLRKGRFCERPRYATGYSLNWRETRTGNLLIRRKIVTGLVEPFSHRFPNGGEDQEFFKRMLEDGRVAVWCDEAIVYEMVPFTRCRRRYVLLRALRRGQAELHFTDARSIFRSLVAVIGYSMTLPLLLVAGQHRFMRNAMRICDHAGKVLAFFGFEPAGREYISR
jgi:glycosyltransferase involved in cell wall biosynthesis